MQLRELIPQLTRDKIASHPISRSSQPLPAVAPNQDSLRAALRRQKRQWDAELQKLGLYLKGYEVRGYRRPRAGDRATAHDSLSPTRGGKGGDHGR